VSNVPVKFIVWEGIVIDQAGVQAIGMADLLPVVRNPQRINNEG